MSRHLYIGGVSPENDRWRDYVSNKGGVLAIEQELTSIRDSAKFSVKGEEPFQGEEVVIMDDSLPGRLFAGIIKKVELIESGQNKTNVWSVDCDDYTELLDKKLINEVYENIAGDAVFRDLLLKYFPDFTGNGIQGSAPIIESYPFEYVHGSEAFNAIAEYTGRYWYPDYYKDIKYFSPEDLVTPAPMNIVSGSHFRNLRHKIDTQGLCNRVYVRGGKTLSDTYHHEIVADGKARAWVLPHKAHQLTVKVGATDPVTPGIENIDDPTIKAYLQNFQERRVVATPATTTPVDGITVDFAYKYDIDIITVVEDLESQAKLAAVQRGDGVYEHSIIDESITSVEAAEALSQKYINEHGNAKVRGSFETEVSGWAPGQLVNISLPDRGISGTYLVQKVTISPATVDKWTYKVEYGGRLYGIADYLKALVSAQQKKQLGQTNSIYKFVYGTDRLSISDEAAFEERSTGWKVEYGQRVRQALMEGEDFYNIENTQADFATGSLESGITARSDNTLGLFNNGADIVNTTTQDADFNGTMTDTMASGNSLKLSTTVTGGTPVTFTSTTTWTVPQGVTQVEVLVVGGGGGTGYDVGGGGGGGGVVYHPAKPVTSGQSISVTVGQGGASAQSSGGKGSNGGNSQFLDIIALGGGGGGGYPSNGVGLDGGSGGGGGNYNQAGGNALQGNSGGGTGYGNKGGRSGGQWGGGGGGGAGGPGADGIANQVVAGGAGKVFAITGVSVEYGKGGIGNSDGGGLTATPANIGQGACGTGSPNNSPYSGGSGVVIVRHGGASSYKSSGTYVHPEIALTAGVLPQGLKIYFNKTTPTGTTLVVEARIYSGSAWGNYTTVNSGDTLIPAGTNVSGYKVQWKATLTTINSGVTPTLDDLTIMGLRGYTTSGLRVKPALDISTVRCVRGNKIAWDAQAWKGGRVDAVDGYVDIPFGSGLDLWATSLIIEMEVFIPSASGTGRIISSPDGSNQKCYLAVSGGKFYLGVKDTEYTGPDAWTGLTKFRITLNGNSSKLEYDKNDGAGWQVAIAPQSYTSPFTLAGNFNLGRDPAGGLYFRVFYNYAKFTTGSALQATYNFDEMNGTVVHDSDGTAHGLAYGGFTWHETKVIIETSIDNGNSWQQPTNGGVVPGINLDDDLVGKTLLVGETLTTTSSDVTPLLKSLAVDLDSWRVGDEITLIGSMARVLPLLPMWPVAQWSKCSGGAWTTWQPMDFMYPVDTNGATKLKLRTNRDDGLEIRNYKKPSETDVKTGEVIVWTG